LIMYEDERKAKAMTGKEVLSKQWGEGPCIFSEAETVLTVSLILTILICHLCSEMVTEWFCSITCLTWPWLMVGSCEIFLYIGEHHKLAEKTRLASSCHCLTVFLSKFYTRKRKADILEQQNHLRN
jgi:hypothetical protein